MAKKVIKKSDVAQKGLFDNVTTGAKEAKAQIELLTHAMKILQENAKRVKQSMPKGSTDSTKGQKDFDTQAKKANQTAQAKLNIDKKILLEKKKLQILNQQQNKELKTTIQATQRLTAEQRKSLGTLQKLELHSTKLRATRAKLNLETDRGKRILKQINIQLDKNNAKIRASGDAMKKQKLNVGNYGSAIGKLRGAVARLGLAFGAISLIRGAFTTIKDFQQGQANLASVLGVNTSSMKVLTEQAKELGATTRFTATQVSELQVELAKLGFTQQQIEDMTPATLALAEATGTELANAAAVAGSTLNGFGLKATDTQRVVDVMANAFSKSSLDMEKFKTAMGAVAPVAKTMGFSLEQTTAMLGTLTDSGLDASTAGTSLRNMMLEASKQGLTWQEALDEVKNSQDKAGASLKLFGKRGVAAGVILAENQEKVAGLTDELNDSEGAAAKMAETQRNTLGGALDLLKSAWDGLILSMDEAGGVGETLRNGIAFLADNLGTIVKVLGMVVKGFIAFKVAMFALKLNDQISQFRSTTRQVGGLGNAMKSTAAKVGTFGRALKGLALAGAISLLSTLAKKFFDVSTEARRTAGMISEIKRRTDSSNKAALEWVNKFRDKTQKAFDDRMKRFDIEAIAMRKAGKTDAEINEAKVGREKAATRMMMNSIGLTRKSLLAKLEVAKADQIISDKRIKNMSASEKAANKAASAFGLTAQPEVVKTSNKNDAAVIRITESLRLLQEEYTANSGELNKLRYASLAYIETSDTETQSVEKKTKAYKDLTEEIMRQAEVERTALEEKEAFDIENLQTDSQNELEKQIANTLKNGKVNTKVFKQRLEEEQKLRKAIIERQFLEDMDVATTAEDVVLATQRRNQGVQRLDEEMIERKLDGIKQLNDAQEDFADEKKKKDDAKTAKEKEDEKEKIRLAKQAIDFTEKMFIASIDKKISKLDEEIEAHRALADSLKESAREGNITAKESLAEENRLIREAQAEKAEQEKRKQQILMVSAFIKTYLAAIDSGEKPQDALVQAVTSQALLDGVVASIGSFFDGTEDTGTVGNPLDSNGGRIAVLHNNERVLTAKQNSMIGSVTNDEVARVMEQKRLGKLVDGNQVAVGWENMLLIEQLNKVGSKLDKVNKTIENKPETNIELGAITSKTMEIIESRKKGGLKTISTFKVKAQ